MASAKHGVPTRHILLVVVVLLFLFSVLRFLSIQKNMISQQPVTNATILVNNLQMHQITAEVTGDKAPAIGLGSGRVIRVNTDPVQVFEFSSPEAAKSKLQEVKADGYTIGSVVYEWNDAPHFFQKDNVITLYIGNNRETIQALAKELGPQRAGAK